MLIVFKPRIDHLGLLMLISTDLDTLERTGGASVQPAKGTNQKTNNATLKSCVPGIEDADAAAKTLHVDGFSGKKIDVG